MTTFAPAKKSPTHRRLGIAICAHLGALRTIHLQSASWISRAEGLAEAAFFGRENHDWAGMGSLRLDDFQSELCLETLIFRAIDQGARAPSELLHYLKNMPSLEHKHFKAGGPPPPAVAIDMHAYVRMIFDWEIDGLSALDAFAAIEHLQAFESLSDDFFSRPLRELFVLGEQMAIAAEVPYGLGHGQPHVAKRL